MKRRGRPPLIPGNPATACLFVRVTKEVAADLQAVARDNQTTRADVIREAVSEYVSDYRERPIFIRISGPNRVSSCR